MVSKGIPLEENPARMEWPAAVLGCSVSKKRNTRRKTTYFFIVVPPFRYESKHRRLEFSRG
jgi:hypothetical protein